MSHSALVKARIDSVRYNMEVVLVLATSRFLYWTSLYGDRDCHLFFSEFDLLWVWGGNEWLGEMIRPKQEKEVDTYYDLEFEINVCKIWIQNNQTLLNDITEMCESPWILQIRCLWKSPWLVTFYLDSERRTKKVVSSVCTSSFAGWLPRNPFFLPILH